MATILSTVLRVARSVTMLEVRFTSLFAGILLVVQSMKD